MILLRSLLEISDTYKPGDVWTVERSGRFGGMNRSKVIRYFDEENDARDFAAGKIKGPKSGRAEPKDVKQKNEPVQKYDVRPK
jgi:hypothetical protein